MVAITAGSIPVPTTALKNCPPGMDHEGFRYPTSSNPYFAKLQAVASDATSLLFIDHAAEKMQGRWKSLHEKSDVELHLEIGCNGAHVLTPWAKQNPHRLYVGLEYKFKQVYLAYERGRKAALKNMALIRGNAERVHFLFAPGEVDHIYLFFPDPWSKRAQNKKRLLRKEWLDRICNILKKGGQLEIKTDHDDYFSWMQNLVKTNTAWRILEESNDLHAQVLDPEKLSLPDVTLFEKVWIRQGIKIKRLLLEKK